MSFSRETREKISRFAKEEARNYLDAAEMTYIERLRKKTGQIKGRAAGKLARFKISSDRSLEAQNDLELYMSDYMDDLISKGMAEEEALERAKEELTAGSEASPHAELHERFRRYYENRDPADYEAVGLFYGGFLLIGITAGALAGYIISGGRQEFLSGGWIDTLAGTFAGLLFGVGLGSLCHGIRIRSSQI